MPNWCNNSVTVSHPDKEMMAKFADGVKNGNLLATFIPMPEEKKEDWYGWNVDNWGTKWDVCSGEFELDEDGLSGNGWFDTAWSPPTSAYSKLQDLGFSIDAGYSESGMGFVGTWIDGDEDYIDSYYDLFEEEDWRSQVDESNYYIIDYLEAEYESWLENRENEE
jgi:hypothetical protein